MRDAPNKNCALDPVPTWLVKQFVKELSPFLAVLFDESMRRGTFPASQKAAIVVPALKKSTLDPLDMANYRPISKLSFVSKLLDRCVNDQLSGHLRANRSRYRKCNRLNVATIRLRPQS